MATTELARGLAWVECDDHLGVVTFEDQPLASFDRTADGRVRARIELLSGRRAVDVTCQPGSVTNLVRSEARRRGADPNAWETAIARRLDRFGGPDPDPGSESQSAREAEPSLAASVVRLAYPIVRQACDQGALPPPHVPRWAAPTLACARIDLAARTAFGDRTNRRVARALARSLGRIGEEPGPMRLLPLGFAMALGDDASADGIANLLEAATAEHSPQHWLDVDDVAIVARGSATVGATAASSLATDALTSLDGPSRLVRIYPAVVRHVNAGAPPPRRLRDAWAVARDAEQGEPPRVIALPHVPRRAPAAPAERAAPPAPHWRPAPNRPDQPDQPEGLDRPDGLDRPGRPARPARPDQPEVLAPIDRPARPDGAGGPDGHDPRDRPDRADRPGRPDRPGGVARPDRANDRRAAEFVYPPEIERLDGGGDGDFTLVLPRTAAEIRHWGEELSNCLPDYLDAITAGRSVVFGLTDRGRLVAALEMEPGGLRVRQFVRDGNQRPRPAQREAVVRILGQLGVPA